MWADPDPPAACITVLRTTTVTHQLNIVEVNAVGGVSVNHGEHIADQATAAQSLDFTSSFGGTRADLLNGLVTTALGAATGVRERWQNNIDLGEDKWSAVYRVLPDTTAFPLLVNFGDAADTYGHDAGGVHVGYGGQLTDMAKRAWTIDPLNWGRPRFDGFGLPIDWIPPSNPELIGANAGEDAVSYYIRTARTAAQEATEATKLAIETLKEETLSSAEAQLAREKARELEAIETKALCGEEGCDETDVSVHRLVAPPSCPPTQGGTFCSGMQASINYVIKPNGPEGSGYLVHRKAVEAVLNRSQSNWSFGGGRLEQQSV
jgi:hypothetical protein